LPGELERLLVAKAEGSPFCVEEITRSLIEEGYLVANGGGRKLTRPVDEIRIPGTVQEVIAARLDRLGPPAKRVAQVAAVIGRQFHRDQLARVLDGEGIDLERELAELESRGIFHRKSLLASDEYRFGESLTQEVAYEGLLLKQRRQLHERVALVLEAEPGEAGPERSALLAHHYARSDNRAKALAALLRAAEDAEDLPSYRTAVDFYRRLWELAEADGDDPTARRAALARARRQLRDRRALRAGAPRHEMGHGRARADRAPCPALRPLRERALGPRQRALPMRRPRRGARERGRDPRHGAQRAEPDGPGRLRRHDLADPLPARRVRRGAALRGRVPAGARGHRQRFGLHGSRGGRARGARHARSRGRHRALPRADR